MSGERAASYGDGLFETMRAHGGDLPWWPRHWARLQRGAHALRLTLPDEAQARETSLAALQADGARDAALKLHVARAGAGRGYAPATPSLPAALHVSVHPLPETPTSIALRWCATRLALQPALAGLKHCNRLEQVLARIEWEQLDDPAERGTFDGLMRSTRGDVVSAVSANVFIRIDGRWITPCVDRCGVAGVMRAWVIEQCDVLQRRVSPAQVEACEALFLTNAVRGILPVARLGTRCWAPHPDIAALQRALAAAHPGFAD